jgi:myo-inositol-1(or 4)-monophosphatase
VSSAADDLTLVEAVAREAGEMLRDSFLSVSRREISSKSTPTDLVSEADLAAEDLIGRRLAEACPRDGILGEEGSSSEGTSGRRWVVDPLDGTVNFLFGIPQWGVSIAVEDSDGALAGVVYDPMRDECWAATRDGEPTLNGQRIEGSSRDELATAMVATGFGYDSDVRAVQAEIVARLLPLVRDIRRLGSAALDLVWAAAGRYDAYFERGTQPWDVAAGELVCRRAGMEVRRLSAMPPAQGGILVAAPGIVEELHALVGP